MAELWLLCEGGTDIAVLNPVFTRVLPTEIAVLPAGGEANLGAAAAYVREQRGGTVAYVRDRDYRTREQADKSFSDGKQGFIWRRHSIENYLLEPQVVTAAFANLKETMTSVPGGQPKWVASLPDDGETVAEGLRECAESIAPREAARIALWRLREELNEDPGSVQLREPNIPTGSASADAVQCKKALMDEVSRFVDVAEKTAKSPRLSKSSAGSRYDDLLARVTSSGYIEKMQFLEEFHGRDLLQQFQQWLAESCSSKLGMRQLAEELTSAVPEVYREFPTLYGTDDLRDLANGVRALGGLDPIA